MAWSAPIIHAVGDILTASDWNISSNDLSFLAGSAGATVATSQTTTSTSYTDLSTVGPAVTVTTGANAIVLLAANLANSIAGDTSYMGVAVSGATTIAAPAGTNSLLLPDPIAGFSNGLGIFSFVSGLTPGSNTFTAKYQVSAGTGTFGDRTIAVIPLP